MIEDMQIPFLSFFEIVFIFSALQTQGDIAGYTLVQLVGTTETDKPEQNNKNTYNISTLFVYCQKSCR